MKQEHKHALETQKDLLALAREIAPKTVDVSASEHRLFFDSWSQDDLDRTFRELSRRFREVTSRAVKVHRSGGRRLWRIDTGELRRMIRVVLTEEEKNERSAGLWYGASR